MIISTRKDTFTPAWESTLYTSFQYVSRMWNMNAKNILGREIAVFNDYSRHLN